MPICRSLLDFVIVFGTIIFASTLVAGQESPQTAPATPRPEKSCSLEDGHVYAFRAVIETEPNQPKEYELIYTCFLEHEDRAIEVVLKVISGDGEVRLIFLSLTPELEFKYAFTEDAESAIPLSHFEFSPFPKRRQAAGKTHWIAAQRGQPQQLSGVVERQARAESAGVRWVRSVSKGLREEFDLDSTRRLERYRRHGSADKSMNTTTLRLERTRFEWIEEDSLFQNRAELFHIRRCLASAHPAVDLDQFETQYASLLLQRLEGSRWGPLFGAAIERQIAAARAQSPEFGRAKQQVEKELKEVSELPVDLTVWVTPDRRYECEQLLARLASVGFEREEVALVGPSEYLTFSRYSLRSFNLDSALWNRATQFVAKTRRPVALYQTPRAGVKAQFGWSDSAEDRARLESWGQLRAGEEPR